MLIVCYITCILDALPGNAGAVRLFVVIFAGENSFRKQLEKHFKKKVMKTIGTFVLALAAMVASAVEKPRLDIYPLSSDRAVVALFNDKPAKLEVSLKSEAGRVVYYKQTIKSDGDYRKIFDFSNLENGNYELSFKLNNTLVMRKIQVEDGGLNIGVSETRFDPFFKLEGEVLKLSYLNFDQNSLTLVFLKDREVVYETSLGREFNTIRGFDLSKLEKGRYDLVLADGNNDFYYTIEK